MKIIRNIILSLIGIVVCGLLIFNSNSYAYIRENLIIAPEGGYTHYDKETETSETVEGHGYTDVFGMLENKQLAYQSDDEVISFWGCANSVYELPGSGVYCAQASEKLRDTQVVSHRIHNKITIVGDVSTDAVNGNNINSYENAKLAYIISGSDGDGSTKTRGPVQIALWLYLDNWLNYIGVPFHDMDSSFATGLTPGNVTTDQMNAALQLIKDAEDYAASIGAGKTEEEQPSRHIIDNTNKDYILPTQITDTQLDKEAIEIGPFNFQFDGTLGDLYIYNENNLLVNTTDRRITDSEGNTTILPSDIKSGEDFYIRIYNQDLEDFSKFSIEVNGDLKVKTAEIYFLEARAESFQSLIVTEPGEEIVKKEITFYYEPKPPTIILKKHVEGDTSAMVENATFRVIYTDLKGVEYYVNVNNEGKVTYATRYVTIVGRNVTERVTVDRLNLSYGDEIIKRFENGWAVETRPVTDEDLVVSTYSTDINGEIILNDVRPGEYTAIEIDAPRGFEIINQNTDFTVPGRGVKIVYIANKLTGIFAEGLVWLDNPDGKQSTINNIYDGNEEGVPGVKVEIMRGGSVIGVTVTDDDGTYTVGNLNSETGKTEPVEIPIENINDYYIQFSYDGFVYETRLSYNEMFAVIEGTEDYEGTASNEYGGEEFELLYNSGNYSSIHSHPDNFYIIQNEHHGVCDSSYHGTYAGDDYQVVFSDKEITGWKEGEHYDRNAGIEGADPYMICTYTPIRPYLDAEPQRNEKYIITATTDLSEYDLDNSWDGHQTLEGINMGLKLRDKADIAIINDLDNVRIEINDEDHVYEYDKRQSFANDVFEIGNRIDTKNTNAEQSSYYTMSYQREVYPTDYEHTDPNGITENEMVLYATYTIKIKNQATNLKSEVNQVLNYYDARYTINKIGSSLDENGYIDEEWDVNQVVTELGSSGGYKQSLIDTTMLSVDDRLIVDPGETRDIYIEYVLPREELNKLAESGEETLQNLVEIQSYSSYYRLQNSLIYYAAVDTDSNPGNAELFDLTTFEDDTDRAPGLKIKKVNERTLDGIVFEDTALGVTKETVSPGNERLGSGIYETGEAGIGGVKVTFKEPNGMVYEATTVPEDGTYIVNRDTNLYNLDSGNSEIALYSPEYWNDTVNTISKTKYTYTKADGTTGGVELKAGQYYIDDYVPGIYTLTYEWGSEEYQVNNYKGTNYNNARLQDGDKWHVTDAGTRYTDAMDHYNDTDTQYNGFIADTNTRLEIDAAIDDLKYNTTTTINNMSDIKDTKLLSSTPKMAVGVENEVVNITDGEIKYTYAINNADFGIIERPIQDVTVMKRVETLKLTLATGQTFIDITIGEDGTVTGQNTAAKVVSKIKDPNGAEISIEMDNEILQGSTLEVGYRYDIKNNSEKDYVDENYYKYGNTTSYDQSSIVKFLYTEVIDYLDKDWAVDLAVNANNNDWVKEDEGYLTGKTEPAVYATIDNKTYEQTDIENYLILSRDAVENKDALMKPGETITYKLDVSKILTSANDIELDNEFEIINLTKTGGSEIQTTVGNYVPGGSVNETDDDKAEHISIIPPTGANLDYTTPTIVVVISLGVIIIGIFVIRKVVLKSKKQ